MINWNYLTTKRFQFCFIISLGAFTVYAQRLFFSYGLIAYSKQNDSIPISGQEVNQIQGLFYLGYAMFQFPSSLLYYKFGTKILMFVFMMMLSCTNLMIPLLVKYGFWGLALPRLVVGLFAATFFPGFFAMMPKWAPINEVNTMIAMEGAGIHLGTILTPALTEKLIKYGDYKVPFYFWGSIGMIYSVLWIVTIYDTPQDHPTITKEEMFYLKESIPGMAAMEKLQKPKIPVRKLLTCMPLWTFFFTLTAYDWCMYLIQTILPHYMNDFLEMEFNTNATLTSLMSCSFWIGQVFFTFLCNFLLRRNVISRTNIRKLMNVTGCSVPAMGLIALGFVTKETKFLCVPIISTMQFFVTAVFLGSFMSTVENVPTHSGIAFAVINTMSSGVSYGSSAITGSIINQSKIYGWQISFAISAGVFLFAMIFHLIFGHSELSPWEKEYAESGVAGEIEIKDDESNNKV